MLIKGLYTSLNVVVIRVFLLVSLSLAVVVVALAKQIMDMISMDPAGKETPIPYRTE